LEKRVEKLSLIVTKMSQHYADNLVRNPDQFKSGLGKNVKNKKKNNNKRSSSVKSEKREKRKVVKKSKFIESVTQGPSDDFESFTQGPIEWILGKVSDARFGVESTLRAPVDELVNFLKEEEVGQSLKALAQTARDGEFKVLFGLDSKSLTPVLLLVFVLVLPFLSRVQIISSIALISLFFAMNTVEPIFIEWFDSIKSFVGFGKEVTQFSFNFSTCYRFGLSCFALWHLRARFGEEASSFEKVHSIVKSFKIQVSKASDISESLGSFQEFVRDAIEIVNNIFGLKFDTSWCQGETWIEIENLNKKFLELKDQYEKRLNLHSVASQMVSLEAYGMSLLNRFKTGGPAYVQYRDAMIRIVALREELGKLGVYGNSTRQEPLFILVGGQAGVGKSSASKVIQGVLIKESCGSEAVREFNRGNSGPYVYVPEQESKFLDGYNNQAICLLDDFASSTEALQNWASKLIPLVNSQAMMTPQASLERKGAVYFDSKFILGTTNVTTYAGILQNMYSKEAVTRRMHVTIKCRVKPEFSKPSITGAEPTLDEQATELYYLENPRAPPCFWLDWWWFNPLTGEETPLCKCGRVCTQVEQCERASTHDVLKMIIQIYRYRVGYQERSEKRMSDFLSQLESEDDTLVALDSAFTQARCNNPLCYACEPNLVAKRDIMVHYLTWSPFSGFNPNNSQPVESMIMSHAEHISYLRSIVSNRDVAKNIFGIRSAFTPVCISEFARKFNFVELPSQNKFLDEYLMHMKLWSACNQASRLVQVKDSIIHCFYDDNIMESVMSKLKLVGAALGMCALIYKTYTTTKPFFKKKNRRTPREALAVVQSADVQHDQVVKSLLSSNVLTLSDDGSFCGYAFGIGGSLVVMNKHIFHSIVKEHTNITFSKMTSKKNRFSYTVTVKSLAQLECPNNDLVCVKVFGFNCQNVLHHIADDVHTTPSFNVRLSHWSGDDDKVVVSMNSGMARLGRPVAASNPDGTVYKSIDTLEYDIATENGQCGAILTRVDATKRSKIVGIHAAGSPCGSRGIGIILKKKFVEECFSHFDVAVTQFQATTDMASHFVFGQSDNTTLEDVQVCGKATSVATVYKSEICKSPLYGEIAAPPLKRPALLNPFVLNGKLFDPVAESLKSYSRGGLLCNMEVLNAATDVYNHELLKETTRPIHAVLSFEETVTGSKVKAPYLKPINRGTASGSPSRFHADVGTKKRQAFGFDENYTFDTPGAVHIKKQFDEALGALKKGPIPMVFVAFPKDELRPTEKVKAGKTRVVFSCDVVNTLLIRKYFGTFASWYQDPANRYKNSSAVGINVADQFELKSFVEKLGNGSLDVNVYAGDHSSFDKNLPSYAVDKVWAVYEVNFGHLLSEEDLKIAKNIFYSFTKPFIQYKDCLIEWDNSNPSGNPITTILNTICNNIILRYGVARSLGAEDFVSARKMLKKMYEERVVEYICYGDDNVWKVDTQKLLSYGTATITYASMTKAMAEMGMVYTDEEKNAEFNESHRTVFDVSFLKRKVALEDGVLYMRLTLDTITQNIQWAKKKDVDGELFRVKVEGFLDELSVHTKEDWDFWRSDFHEAAQRVDPKRHFMVNWNKSQCDRRAEYLARGCEYW